MTEDPIAERHKIEILLHEYDTLRQEILTRTNAGVQYLSVIAILFVLIMQLDVGVKFWISLTATTVLAILGLWINFRDISKAARRIAEIELDVNARAGETLLVWETSWGARVAGWLGKSDPLSDSDEDPLGIKRIEPK